MNNKYDNIDNITTIDCYEKLKDNIYLQKLYKFPEKKDIKYHNLTLVPKFSTNNFGVVAIISNKQPRIILIKNGKIHNDENIGYQNAKLMTNYNHILNELVRLYYISHNIVSLVFVNDIINKSYNYPVNITNNTFYIAQKNKKSFDMIFVIYDNKYNFEYRFGTALVKNNRFICNIEYGYIYENKYGDYKDIITKSHDGFNGLISELLYLSDK